MTDLALSAPLIEIAAKDLPVPIDDPLFLTESHRARGHDDRDGWFSGIKERKPEGDRTVVGICVSPIRDRDGENASEGEEELRSSVVEDCAVR